MFTKILILFFLQQVIWLRLEAVLPPVVMDYVFPQASAAVNQAGQERPATKVSKYSLEIVLRFFVSVWRHCLLER